MGGGSLGQGSKGTRLDSWKAIADYLGRDVRSVQRWERQRGLPVHRVPGEKGGGVFAYSDELDCWLVSRSPDQSPDQTADTVAVVPSLDAPEPNGPEPQQHGQASVIPSILNSCTSTVPRPPVSARRLGRWLAAAAVVILALGATAYFALRRPRPLAKPAPGRVMLAVLPFLNLSGDASQDYFADGLTEEMITDLGRMNPNALGVIARTSAMTYQHSSKNIRQIGKELGVNYVLEGSVRREGDQTRISAQLIRVSDQTHVWAQNFQRQTKDILSVQEDVAQAIAETIRIGLTPGQRARLIPRRPANPAAYDDYLKGLYFWGRRSVGGMTEGIQFFEQAVQKDPDYAPAYSGLAQSYTLLGIDASPERTLAGAKARAAALKAVDLDDSSAEAHTALAGVRVIFDYDWAGARVEFQRALELNPNYALAHHWYANLYLDPQGRFQDAINEMRRAQALDPLSLIINTDLGYAYFLSGQLDTAAHEYEQVLAMDATFVPAHLDLAQIYEQKGMYDDWLREYVKIVTLTGDAALAQKFEAIYARGGYRMMQLECARSLGTYGLKAERPRRAFFTAARAYAMLGDRDHALAMLSEAVKRREPGLLYLGVDPAWNPLRSEPRFQSIERTIGLK